MFSLFNGIYDSYLAPSQLNLLIVGGTNSGKSALLERLKVTEIPTCPKASSEGAEQMTQTLYAAFVATGAVDVAGRRKSSIRKITDTKTKNNAAVDVVNRQLAAAEASPQPVTRRRFPRFNICPAPERYLKSSSDQDEEFEDNEMEQERLLNRGRSRSPRNLEDDENNDSFSEPPRRVRCHSKEFDVDSLDLMDAGRRSSMQDISLSSSSLPKIGAAVENNSSSKRTSVQPRPTVIGAELLQSSTQQYHLRANAKMLPLIKIRPTIGTNLGKLDMYGAKCHIFDVGGRLQDLWERYYDDCDAVIFCWKLGEDPDEANDDNDSDDDDKDNDPQSTYDKQLKMLNSVRKSIPDDVPFL
ncbi:MAG: hypothetical protein SGARI_006321, partial [Bacillariaceae sp.]